MHPEPESNCALLGWICFETLATLLDVVHHFFPPSQPKHSPSDIDDLSDRELFRLESRALDHSESHSGTHNIDRITQNTVIKYALVAEEEYSREMLALQVVASQTTIPVPHVRRLAIQGTGDYRRLFFAMEHIPGRPLSVIWPTLSWFGRLRVALTLRSYVRQLRKIQHPRSLIPGPLSPPGMGGQEFFSPLWFVPCDYRGPFETYDEFLEVLKKGKRRTLEKGFLETSLTLQEAFDSSWPLVLTHSDINPRNIIVGDDGHLWLIDFGWAGFFPVWWEFVSMRLQAENEDLVRKGPDASWDAIIPLVCGRFYRLEKWYLEEVAPGLWYR